MSKSSGRKKQQILERDANCLHHLWTLCQPELMIQHKACRICTAFADKKLTSKISTQDRIESHL